MYIRARARVTVASVFADEIHAIVFTVRFPRPSVFMDLKRAAN